MCIQYQPNVHYTIVGFVKIPSDDNIENNSSVLMFHVKSKQFSTMMSSFKISDSAWKYRQMRISQDAYLCKMWYVKLVAQNCTYFSAAQKKLSHALSQKAKNWIWKVINLDGLISSCSNMILSRFSHFQCKYRLWDYILSLRYMQELTLIGMRGILLSPCPF